MGVASYVSGFGDCWSAFLRFVWIFGLWGT